MRVLRFPAFCFLICPFAIIASCKNTHFIPSSTETPRDIVDQWASSSGNCRHFQFSYANQGVTCATLFLPKDLTGPIEDVEASRKTIVVAEKRYSLRARSNLNTAICIYDSAGEYSVLFYEVKGHDGEGREIVMLVGPRDSLDY